MHQTQNTEWKWPACTSVEIICEGKNGDAVSNALEILLIRKSKLKLVVSGNRNWSCYWEVLNQYSLKEAELAQWSEMGI